MLCRSPSSGRGGLYWPCGQCLPCRINRRRVWTHRILLESLQYKDNCFVTLTYSDENIVFAKDKPTLVSGDLQRWMKRLRKKVSVRYFAVGEYGDDTGRPHYHVALFGYPCCSYGRSIYGWNGRKDCCAQCNFIRDSWGLGNILVGDLSVKSAQYVCGYVTKKMTAKDDVRLDGRFPEFARMSRRPGIGSSSLWEVSSELMRYGLENKLDDVPVGLRHGSRILPLGRFMRGKLRLYVGRDEGSPKEVQIARSAEMLPLRVAARNSSEGSLKELIIESSAGRVASLEAREGIFKKRSVL